jgi:hypothetical protein
VLPTAVSDHYASQQRLAVVTLAAARSQWRRMGVDYDASWARVGTGLVVLLTAAQIAAARAGAAYVPAALEEQGVEAAPAGQVVPAAFAGTASDGRPLAGLLYSVVVHAKVATTRMEPPAALRDAEAYLDRVFRTQVADAARGAAGVAITARPGVDYVRMLNPPSCSRCTILAGRRYGWNAGFPRHPGCDCRHVPVAEDTGDDLTTDPRRYFDSLSEAEQDRTFTKAGAQAIRDGADMGQVVNARRGMDKASGTTTEGATGRRGQPPRLMPERIYETASNREEALALLRANGFLT